MARFLAPRTAMLLVAFGVALTPLHGLAQDSPPALASSVVAEPTVGMDATGRMTVRARRVAEPLSLDGRLDEAIYGAVSAAEIAYQQEPIEGDPASERTEMWIFFDDRNLYISVRCWDSEPDRMIANELRRDGNAMAQGENVAIALDTFLDRRNGFYFQTNPLGALRDQEVRDEGNQNPDWNAVWDVKAGRFEQGWTAEMAIPFRSLRYGNTGPTEWGINVRRTIAWKNERVFLTPMPASFGVQGIYKFSREATLVGLETPPKSLNLEVKPYGISSLTTDRAATTPFSNRTAADAGVDVKYGLTSALTADLTVNTDFAQVEADEQQVNLTRFSLLLPEKRDFFLEGRNIFAFGAGSGGGGGGGGGGRGGGEGGGGGDVPIMFFSRQIGVSRGRAVPVRAGGRLTGRVGPFTIGALNVQTGDAPEAGALATNFSVLRVTRDILERSSVGVIATRRAPSATQGGSSTAAGVDANFQFRTDWEAVAYYAATRTPGASESESSYRAQIAYNGDRYGLQAGHLMVGSGFDPQIGFVRRQDFRASSAVARFSPRPESIPWIRRFVWQASFEYVTDADGSLLESREAQGVFRAEMENGDTWSIQYSRQYEFLEDSFAIATDVVLPVGRYSFGAVNTSYNLGPLHLVNGRLSAEHGSFYDGVRTSLGYSGRLEFSPRLSLEPGLSQNWVDLDEGSFTRRLVTARVIFSPSARSALSSLLQYNSANSSWSSNVRFQWEYSPGSDLYVVYSDARDTSQNGFPELQNRTLAVKLTHLLRF